MTRMEYIRLTYNVPAKRGMIVVANGRPGMITGTYMGARLRIRVDGVTRNYHPTWNIIYPKEDA